MKSIYVLFALVDAVLETFFWSANTNGDLIWSNACRISMDQTAEQVLTFVKVYLAFSCARVGRSFIERGFGGTGPQELY